MIEAAHTVTLDTTAAVSSTATINGRLMAHRTANSSWTVVGGDVKVNPGGWLDYGADADYVFPAYIAHLVLASGTYAGQYGLIVNDGGDFTVRGAEKTPYAYATQDITAVQTELRVYGSTSVAGWASGDVITIGPTSGTGNVSLSSRTIDTILDDGAGYIVYWNGGPLGTARTLSAGQVDRLEDRIDEAVENRIFVGHVVVERHRLDAQLLGHHLEDHVVLILEYRLLGAAADSVQERQAGLLEALRKHHQSRL